MTKRQEAKAVTREKVLKAGRTCFGAYGYERATIRDIAATAGMSTGAVFASFADKAALYEAVHGHAPVSPEAGASMLKALREIALGSPDIAPPYRAMGAAQMQAVARVAIAAAKEGAPEEREKAA